MASKKNTSSNFRKIVLHYRPLIAKGLSEILTIPFLANDVKVPLLYHFGLIQENGEKKSLQTFPGKGIRPILLATTYKALGGDHKKLLPLFMALELIHNFSLIHDDIEDKDNLRHGFPTLWTTKRWGVEQAINTGDFTLIFGLQQILQLKNFGFSDREITHAMQLVLQATSQMAQGQHMDLQFEKTLDISIDEYMKMIQRKTGAMIALPILLAVYLSGSSKKLANSLATYAHALGKLFQLRDDYLGIWGKSNTTGKSQVSDIKKRKKTFPVVYSLEKITNSTLPFSQKQFFRKFYESNQEVTSREVQEIKKILKLLDSEKPTKEIIEKHYAIAITAIINSDLSKNNQKELLIIADFLATREY